MCPLRYIGTFNEIFNCVEDEILAQSWIALLGWNRSRGFDEMKSTHSPSRRISSSHGGFHRQSRFHPPARVDFVALLRKSLRFCHCSRAKGSRNLWQYSQAIWRPRRKRRYQISASARGGALSAIWGYAQKNAGAIRPKELLRLQSVIYAEKKDKKIKAQKRRGDFTHLS